MKSPQPEIKSHGLHIYDYVGWIPKAYVALNKEPVALNKEPVAWVKATGSTFKAAGSLFQATGSFSLASQTCLSYTFRESGTTTEL